MGKEWSTKGSYPKMLRTKGTETLRKTCCPESFAVYTSKLMYTYIVPPYMVAYQAKIRF